MPGTSNVRFVAGQTVGDTVIVPVDQTVRARVDPIQGAAVG